ncbi:MAG: bis(5'-nucleosyl)-tetraphosphatase [Bacilli bacterium]
MKKEKSCGAIIYKCKNNKLYFLIVKHNAGHYSFPKGHIEKGETEEETAIREVKEETNIDIEIIPGFREKITYSPKENTIKDVIFFLAKPLSYNLKPQEEEIEKVSWYDEKEALNIITYKEDKNIFKSALLFIKNNI